MTCGRHLKCDGPKAAVVKVKLQCLDDVKKQPNVDDGQDRKEEDSAIQPRLAPAVHTDRHLGDLNDTVGLCAASYG